MSKIIESLPQSSNYTNSETSPLPSLPVHGQFARRFKGVRWIFSGLPGNRDPSLSPLVMRRRDNEWRGRGVWSIYWRWKAASGFAPARRYQTIVSPRKLPSLRLIDRVLIPVIIGGRWWWRRAIGQSSFDGSRGRPSRWIVKSWRGNAVTDRVIATRAKVRSHRAIRPIRCEIHRVSHFPACRS